MESISLAAVLTAHEQRIENVILAVPIEGKTYLIRGTRTSLVDMGIPAVVLLAENSTPHVHVQQVNAPELFIKAVATLVSRKTSFYTHLRPNWALPAFEWKLV